MVGVAAAGGAITRMGVGTVLVATTGTVGAITVTFGLSWFY